MSLDLQRILREGIAKRASDIHITTGRPVTFRIDGNLVASNDHNVTSEEISVLLKPLYYDNELLKARLEEEGEIDFAYTLNNESRFRCNIFHQRGDLGIVLRLLPVNIPRPESLGVPDSVVELTKLKRGLVLVTGPTGSGKSTTLASLIGVINRNYTRHIITLEDPIEYVHQHNKSIVNQRELGQDTKSFANGLRAALREDPDVILVGEMRDLETISTAITAAETGHLVFSTLHTNNAGDTINRVIDVFPPHQQQQIRTQLANVLVGVIAQQLLPYKGGFGRCACFEVMLANPAIRNLIREDKCYQIQSQIQTSRREGMQTMDDALYDLYFNNQITAEDAIQFALDPQAMSRKVLV